MANEKYAERTRGFRLIKLIPVALIALVGSAVAFPEQANAFIVRLIYGDPSRNVAWKVAETRCEVLLNELESARDASKDFDTWKNALLRVDLNKFVLLSKHAGGDRIGTDPILMTTANAQLEELKKIKERLPRKGVDLTATEEFFQRVTTTIETLTACNKKRQAWREAMRNETTSKDSKK